MQSKYISEEQIDITPKSEFAVEWQELRVLHKACFVNIALGYSYNKTDQFLRFVNYSKFELCLVSGLPAELGCLLQTLFFIFFELKMQVETVIETANCSVAVRSN